MEKVLKLLGNLIIEMETETVTGLRIGAGQERLVIGGVESPFIRHPITNEPYTPGSSFKGKLRSLLEKYYQRPQNWYIGQEVYIHSCIPQKRGQKLSAEEEKMIREDYKKCPVCRLFGVPSEIGLNLPTRLSIGDSYLSKESRDKLSAAPLDLPFAEVKWENVIDRITSHAVPRDMERVPAGTVFSGPRIILSFFHYKDDNEEIKDDTDLFEKLLLSFQLLEEDYLGSCGSRGYGRIKLRNFKLYAHGHHYYEGKGNEETKVARDLQELIKDREDIKKWIEEKILGPGSIS